MCRPPCLVLEGTRPGQEVIPEPMETSALFGGNTAEKDPRTAGRERNREPVADCPGLGAIFRKEKKKKEKRGKNSPPKRTGQSRDVCESTFSRGVGGEEVADTGPVQLC